MIAPIPNPPKARLDRNREVLLMGHTREKLAQNFKDLGIEPGDTLFVHSSFKSLGRVDGGAGTVVGALEDAVGGEGLILMPSFNLLESREKRVAAWNIETTPSTVWWLTEFSRQLGGTYRSLIQSQSQTMYPLSTGS